MGLFALLFPVFEPTSPPRVGIWDFGLLTSFGLWFLVLGIWFLVLGILHAGCLHLADTTRIDLVIDISTIPRRLVGRPPDDDHDAGVDGPTERRQSRILIKLNEQADHKRHDKSKH